MKCSIQLCFIIVAMITIPYFFLLVINIDTTDASGDAYEVVWNVPMLITSKFLYKTSVFCLL